MPNLFARVFRAVPYRWGICTLLFFATTINYVDRQLLGLLAPTLQREIGWSEVEYGLIVTCFQAAYALGLLVFGWLIDRIGSRAGLMLAVLAWSVASMAHGAASTVIHFCIARFGLGLAEAGNFPASVKAVSEWFPRGERAFAIGIFNSGSNVGAIITPLMVPWVVALYGWQGAFYLTGALGVIWLLCAAMLFATPETGRFVSQEERQLILSERERAAGVGSWREAARSRATWGFAVAKFLTDPIWWFYLYWAPKYLSTQFQVELVGLAAPLVVIYLMADVGSIGGGWCSSWLARRGMNALQARQRVMLICASLALLVVLCTRAPNIWAAALLLGIAAAAHQGWSANLFATVSDLFPREAVASVVGIGGMVGAIGGMVIASFTGWILERTHSYEIPFVVCSSAYLVAWFLFRVLVRR